MDAHGIRTFTNADLAASISGWVEQTLRVFISLVPGKTAHRLCVCVEYDQLSDVCIRKTVSRGGFMFADMSERIFGLLTVCIRLSSICYHSHNLYILFVFVCAFRFYAFHFYSVAFVCV